MMMILKIALRNIRRNVRRSSMTISAIAVGAMAMLLFGAFMAYMVIGFQTNTVENSGHLTVFKKGYFAFGTGNPAPYGIAGYGDLARMFRADPVLGPMVKVVTPTVTLFGIAGNFAVDASKTFFGIGIVPSDREVMHRWNEYHLTGRPHPPIPFSDDQINRGIVGVGLARILGLCASLHIADCPAPPTAEAAAEGAGKGAPAGERRDFSALVGQDAAPAAAATEAVLPCIDLLAATAGGAPNVVSLFVMRAEPQGFKELDDNYVAMNLKLAQELLYGRGEPKVTSLVLQLHRTEDIGAARRRLLDLFRQRNLDLEVHDFTELTPMYKQVIGLFGSIFVFIAVIMGVIVLFTVVNTMSMSVMERTNEIGTARAMGVRRSGVRRQFVAEGSALGVIGATAGVALAALAAAGVNRMDLHWMAPGMAEPIPLHLLLSGVWVLIAATWLGLVAVATLAALIPASRAARMPVVDALRHV